MHKKDSIIITETSQEARCLYLFHYYNDPSIKFTSNNRYYTFSQDKEKNLLYSHNHSYYTKNYDFIYKLSNEIKKCNEMKMRDYI